MKIIQITEDTYKNISIIEDVANYIIDTMPDVIPENSTYEYSYYDNNGKLKQPSSQEIKSISELIEENDNDPTNKVIKNTLQQLIHNKIIFHNTAKYLNHDARGDYSWGPINIYVSTIQKSTREFVLHANDEDKWPSFKLSEMIQVLFHEIRHFFQDHEYSTHMRGQTTRDHAIGSEKSWGERQIEWDAKWSDILYGYSPNEFAYAKDYAEAVMDEFKHWVKISPKVETHYYKKTIAYYLNWIRKTLEKQWQKIVKSMDQYLKNGSYTQQEYVDYILEDLSWYANNSNGNLLPAIKQYFKIKSIKHYQDVTKPNRTKNKLNQYIEKYKSEYGELLQNFLNANYNRIKDVNKFGAASAILDKLMDNNPDFFYTKNKSMYEISHEVNKHYYKQTVEYINHLKEIQAK